MSGGPRISHAAPIKTDQDEDRGDDCKQGSDIVDFHELFAHVSVLPLEREQPHADSYGEATKREVNPEGPSPAYNDYHDVNTRKRIDVPSSVFSKQTTQNGTNSIRSSHDGFVDSLIFSTLFERAYV